MSADYDRLFHSSEPGKPVDDATAIVDRDAILKAAAAAPPPPPPVQAGDTSSTDVPVAPTASTQTQAAAQPRHAETTPQMPAPMPQPPATAPQWPQNSMLRAPQQQQFGQGARHEQARTLPGPAPRVAPGPAPSQFADIDPEVSGQWRAGQAIPTPAAPGPTSAASMGNHRAIDALSHVGVKTGVKMPSQRGWRHWLYLTTRINLGLSPDEIYELELHSRIRRNARDSYQIGVFGLKGGVGKTAVTVALGSAMAKVRGDRILAIDADPDGGNLADRAGRQSAATISDLLADQELSRYNDIRAYTSMNGSNLEVLSSEDYSGAQREFNDEDWKGATAVVSRYYNLVLADCGAGLFQKASRGVLSTVSGMVIVASASIDGARQAAITMDWLRQNGYQDLLGRSCVVINHVTPGKPNVDIEDLVQQFERHVPPGRVIVLPYDKHIAAGTEIQLDLLGDTFQRRITELAAALSDDFDRLERR
ncbi:chromosome partitioning protein ParA [Mycolicibacterium conceptionense]|jgi:MinD-like ATPase involved in chromosome partitioning or flagellar assembly|uniref:Chromosome partitioning ATPase n=3 Tax=Mycolicibacterium TaxID=1866885 RepID=A0A378W9F2_9MYCO|nr:MULTISPECIES: MinD/ParA family protein [Mycolicibacterium]KLI05707.1 chromosome partitioning protein ParA [Mycolicibacterium senegalense]KLO52747.1 chromosome partitioning protein ParA [Mycolicibacterium senegalense]KMV18167.1 chromosome partitioning protein ParA [Mycolicibacterium conceptionense]MCW1824169.1 AAA family ATPase [Mycolicibacterium senegalense]OBB11013.1 chromosome partitioning protein ParA [Mycolicibacterium conceptionense]